MVMNVKLVVNKRGEEKRKTLTIMMLMSHLALILPYTYPNLDPKHDLHLENDLTLTFTLILTLQVILNLLLNLAFTIPTQN